MQISSLLRRTFASLTIGALLLAPISPARAQQPATSSADSPATALATAKPLAEDRGAVALVQELKRLSNWGSVMFIVAHPDDEDGGMLTWLSRGLGVRTSVVTLTRGEGGQNAMSADQDDALGLMRTQELLRAGQFYSVRQYFGTQADFGFSKTQEESFRQWGHDRVLSDVVLAIRRERPLILAATFIGGITDGHGQHQVSGEIAQEAYLAAADPTVFPDQLKNGLLPWKPLKIYARVPFAPITDGRMFDYATGKWAPAKFYNYVTKDWTTTAPTPDVTIPSGTLDPVLGRSYSQLAREGWGEQKSQNGGANPALSGGDGSSYHRYASRVSVPAGKESTFFDAIPANHLDGLTTLLSVPAPAWLTQDLRSIAAAVQQAQDHYIPTNPEAIAPTLKSGCQQTLALITRIQSSSLPAADRDILAAELQRKVANFHSALRLALGIDLMAYTVRTAKAAPAGPFGGGFDESSRTVSPGDTLYVRLHTTHASPAVTLEKLWLQPTSSLDWQTTPAQPSSDATLTATVPAAEPPTRPYFSRPDPNQPVYDLSRPELRGDPLSPYPLQAWASFLYDGLSIPLGQIVMTMQREPGRGGVLEPLVVTPAVGLRAEPPSAILPTDGSTLPISVTIHAQQPAHGSVHLTLPSGWTAEPAQATFNLTAPGDSDPIRFLVHGQPTGNAPVTLHAVVEAKGATFTEGWRRIGYPGLLPVNQYLPATVAVRSVDAQIAPGLKVGYIMGTGDEVPQAIRALGITPHLLTPQDLASADLSQWNVLVVGIRAYTVRADLSAAQDRLNTWVRNGGTLIVQYQSSNFPAPAPIDLGGSPEKVVEEDSPISLLAPSNPLLASPNRLTPTDFNAWVEERGHSFAASWDPQYTPLTETADHGQDPQRGGLLITHPGQGTYIYCAYALHKQLPALVPGAWRLLANLLSAGH